MPARAPRTLVENCGGSVIRLLTALRAKHAESPNNTNWGIDGNKGELADMTALSILDPYTVKTQTYKTAFESATMILRIDDIVSGMKSKEQGGGAGGAAPPQDEDTFGDQRDG